MGKTLWSGKVRKEVFEFTNSLPFDSELWREDLDVTIAHAYALYKAHIFNKREFDIILSSAQKVAKFIMEIKKKNLTSEYEDIHTLVEYSFKKFCGESLGGRLRAGRSRNDQIVLDTRLFLIRKSIEIAKLINDVMNSIIVIADENFGKIGLSYTHTRRAQPILFSHLFLSYLWALNKDISRFLNFIKNCDECPAGSGAISGTSIPINPNHIAEYLGFSKISSNSIESVSTRDFCAEFLFICAMCNINLSRICEDIIIFSTDEFGFFEIPEEFSTGSSMMPHKKNPDLFELVRGKCGRTTGNLFALLTAVKGLPSGYSRDFQEDKERILDSISNLTLSLKVVSEALKGLKVVKDLSDNSDKYVLSTDFAEELFLRYKDYHRAHREVWRKLGSGEPIDSNVKTFRDSVRRKNTPQSTNPKFVRKQLNSAKKLTKKIEKELEKLSKRFESKIEKI